MTYPATVPDVPVYGGADLVFADIAVKDADGTATDLTGYTLTAAWRPGQDSATSLALVVTVVSLVEGRFTVSATAETTLAMGRSGVWDVRAVHATEGTTYLVRGATTWMGSVTRG